MPFQFTCPHCFKKTLVEDKYAGQTGPCACCGKIVTLPELATGTRPNLVSSRSVFVSPSIAANSPGITVKRSDAEAHIDDIPNASLADEIQTSTEATQSQSLNVSGPGAAAFPSPSAIKASDLNKAVQLTYDVQAFKRRRLWTTVATLFTLIVLGGVGWMAIGYLGNSSVIQNLQDRRNRMMSLNNLSKVARALNTYAAAYGTYPPSVIYDENGKPKHSWRVLILPQLGEYSLYNQYKFDEPWDSPNNSSIFSKCPYVFTCPAANANVSTAEANCFLITGPGTVSPNVPGQPPLSIRDIGDGTASTFLLVECANPIHQWTKPIDYDASGNGPIKFGGCYNEGTAVAKADGTAVWVPFDAAPESIRAFTTPNGNENVVPDYFKQ